MELSIDVLDPVSIRLAVDRLTAVKNSIPHVLEEIVKRLTQDGYDVAGYELASDPISLEGLSVVRGRVSATSCTYYLRCQSTNILFFEFGAGITYGNGHPWDAEFGMGAGTYPGKGYWNNPDGWYYRDSTGKHHTYGNAPHMPFYKADKVMREELLTVAREVINEVLK